MNRLFALLALIACCSALNVGYFAATGLMAVSIQEKFYDAAGVQVNFVLVPGSIVAYQWIADGTIDGLLTAVDNTANRYYNGILNTTLLSGGDMAPDYVLYGTNGVKTIADLRGKTILVDAVTSGFSAWIQRNLLLNGLVLNQDYTFQGYGGTPVRYQAIVNGKTNANQTAYAALITFPYTAQLVASNRSDIFPLARFSDYTAPYQSISYAVLTSKTKNATYMEQQTRFLQGYYMAYQFANNTNNKAKVIQDLSVYLNVSIPTATAGYAAILDQKSGEVVNNLFLDPLGVLNVLAIRQQTGGFSRQANFTAGMLPVQEGGAFIDYTWLKEAQRRAIALGNGAVSPCQVTISQAQTNGLFLNTYTVTLKNTGNTAANPVLVTSLIDGIAVFNLNPALTLKSGSVTNNYYNLKSAPIASGASVTFTYIAVNMLNIVVSQANAC